MGPAEESERSMGGIGRVFGIEYPALRIQLGQIQLGSYWDLRCART